MLREGGFDRAAAVLGVTQSAVSQRLRGLEETLGQVLVTRSRPPTPTEAGHRLLGYLERLRLLEGEVLAEVRGEAAPAEPLRLGVNADSLATWFLVALAEAMREAEALVELHVDDQDHTFELLSRGEVAACVAARAAPLRGCEAFALGAMRYLCVAAPGFRDRHFAEGVGNAQFRRAPAVLFDRKDDLHAEFLGRHFVVGERQFPHHYVPSSEGCTEAVRLGFGYAMVPAQQAAPLLARGELVELTPGLEVRVPLYWHVWRVRPVRLERLGAALVAAARARLEGE